MILKEQKPVKLLNTGWAQNRGTGNGVKADGEVVGGRGPVDLG